MYFNAKPDAGFLKLLNECHIVLIFTEYQLPKVKRPFLFARVPARIQV